MAFERFSGTLAAAFFLLVFALAILQPSDIAPTLWTLFGQLLTLAVGAWAWYGVREQMKLTRHQIAQSDEAMQHAIEQSRDTRRRQMAADHGRLIADVFKLADDIDQLKLARGYLLKFASEFPNQGLLGGWGERLFRVRAAGDDFISYSATKAPFGWGDKVTTVMSRIHRMGDMMVPGDPQSMPREWSFTNFDSRIAGAIGGIRGLAEQLGAEIQKREDQLIELADARDASNPSKV